MDMDTIIRQAITDNLLNRYRMSYRNTINPNSISNVQATQFISSRYYSNHPPGGYAVDEEHNYIIPDQDDEQAILLVDVIMAFGSPSTSPQTNQLEQTMKRREQIKSIGKYKRINDPSVLPEKSCPICIDDFTCGEYNRTLDCGHIFHKRCIDRWFKKNHSECPMCRKIILK